MHATSAAQSGQPESGFENPQDSNGVPRQRGIANRAKTPSTPSILIHEVKSLPNRLAHEEKGVFSVRLARYADHVASSQDFARYLADRDPDRSKKLSTCGTWLLFREYFELQGKPKKLAAGIFCQQPLWCGFCAAAQAARQACSLMQKFDEVQKLAPDRVPYMLTLTAKSDKDLVAMKTRIWDAWSRLMHKRRNTIAGKSDSIAGTWDGGFVSGEVKRGKGGHGWHYHLHGLVLGPPGRYVPMWERLKREWAGLLGQSHASVQFQPVKRLGSNSIETAILECAKYAVKWDGKQSYDDRIYAAESLARVRRIRTFGCMYGLKLPTDVTDDLSEYEGQAYRDLVFRFLDGSYQKRETLEAQRETAFDEFEHAI